jgi:catechol 2,3-dioxygenase-like lactoylglutathione lyase family enzyme
MFRIASLDHLVLNVSDTDRSLAFYRDTLGLAAERVAEYKSGEFPFPSVRVNAETIIDLFPPQMHGSRDGGSNLNHLCFTVEADSQELRNTLCALGLHIDRVATQNVGARGMGSSFYVSDPDGNSVELKTYSESAR